MIDYLLYVTIKLIYCNEFLIKKYIYSYTTLKINSLEVIKIYLRYRSLLTNIFPYA